MKKYLNLIALTPLLAIPFISNSCSAIDNTFFLTDVTLGRSDATLLDNKMFVDHETLENEVQPQLSAPYQCEDVRVAYGSALDAPIYGAGDHWRNGNSGYWDDSFENAYINVNYKFRVDTTKLKDETKEWINNFNDKKGGLIQLTWDIWEQIDANNDSHMGGNKYIYSKTGDSDYKCNTTMSLVDDSLTINFADVPFNSWFKYGFNIGPTFDSMGANKELVNKFDRTQKNTFIADNHRNKYLIGVDKSLARDYFSIFFQYEDNIHGRFTTK